MCASGIGEVIACEPNSKGDQLEFPVLNLEEVIRRADILVVLVDHEEFKGIDREMLKEKVVIDTRGIWR